MLARLTVATPFLMVVPDNTQFSVRAYDDSGYEVRVYPPVRSDIPLKTDEPDSVEVNGKPGFVANALRIDFLKDRFDMTQRATDPPNDVIARAIASFLTRYRYAIRSPQVSPIEFPGTTWRMEYLNDDGTPVERKSGEVAARGGRGFQISYVALSPEIWEQVHSLDPDWLPPRWNDLLLDAEGALPKVGTAVVLAATALEVFIADTLDDLAARNGFSQPMWEWINHRGEWLKDPSTGEQFDFLLKFFTGHSLQEDLTLWESFQNLRTARNRFVHEGAATLGKAAKLVVTPQKAAQLVKNARDITEWVREKLPEEMKWPMLPHDTKVSVALTLLKNPAPASERKGDPPPQA